MNDGPSRISVVDDHRVILAGIATLLAESFPHASIVTFTSYEEMLSQSGDLGIVLLDLWLGNGEDPISAIERIVARGGRVIIFSQITKLDTLAQCVLAGAGGIVPKQSESDSLIEAIAAVQRDGVFFNADWAAATQSTESGIVRLSPREIDVLRLYAAGLPLKSVARRVGISESTAKEYLLRIRRKYAEVGRPTHGRADFYRHAVDRGLVEDGLG